MDRSYCRINPHCTREMGTGKPDGLKQILENVQLASLVFYCVICIVGILGNGLVIYVTGFRMKRTVNSIWFLNLALADFLFTSFLIFPIISLSQKHQWPFGESMCKLHNIVVVVTMFASVFLLAAISLDRCLSVWVVVWAQNKRTVGKAQIICAVMWVAAAVCSIPFPIFRQTFEKQNKTYCTVRSTMKQKSILTIFRFVMGFFIPFLIILVAHVAICARTRRMQRRKRTSRIIFSIIVAFFICWLPYHVLQFLETAGKNLSIVHIGSTLAVSLAFLNSCLNPILYVFLCDEFQKKLKQSICLVLESAFAEDRLSHMSSRFSRKSDSAAPFEGKDKGTCLNFKENAVVFTRERETLSSEACPI